MTKVDGIAQLAVIKAISYQHKTKQYAILDMVKADKDSSSGDGLEIGPGETEIVCRVSLAAGESCLVSISAKLETRVAIR